MFCVECGSALADNMKFCPYCGLKVAIPQKGEQPQISEKPQVSETPQQVVKTATNDIALPICKEVSPVNFDIFKRSITLEPNRVLYNTLRLQFQKYADIALQQFSRDYNSYNSLKDVIQQSPNHAFKAIQPALKKCIDELIENGIYTIDDETFYGKYVLPLEQWQDNYQFVADQYAEIVMDKEQHAAYRRACKENRGRWVGGGFSVSGAIKGSMAAGTMNAFSGIGYSIVNGIGNALSSANAKYQMGVVFKNPNTRKNLENGVWNTVFAMHQSLIICICEATGNKQLLQGSVTNQATSNAVAILKNISQIPSKEQRETALIDAFYHNPYLEDWYKYVFDTYSDTDGKLGKIADYLGITVVDTLKETALAEMFQNMSLETEEQALEAKNVIVKTKKHLHYNKSSKTLCTIEDALKNFDIQARTVDGILFNTREEAAMNNQEFIAFSARLNDLQNNDLNALEELRATLDQYSGKVAEKYREIVTEKIETLDLARRTVKISIGEIKTLDFPTVREAEDAQEYANRLQALVTQAPIESHDKLSYFYALMMAIEKDARSDSIPEIANLYAIALQKLAEEEFKKIETSRNLIYSYYNDLQNASKKRIYIGEKLKEAPHIIANAKKAYLNELGHTNNEKILLLYDNSTRENGEKGFTITERGFYSTGATFCRKFYIPLTEIASYNIKSSLGDLEFNNKSTDISQTAWSTRDSFVYLVKSVIDSSRILEEKKYSIVIPPSRNNEEYIEKARKLRIHGKYHDYNQLVGSEKIASKELLSAVHSGDVLNYHEIGIYIANQIDSFGSHEKKKMYVGQSTHSGNFRSNATKAISEYLGKLGFNEQEYLILVYSEESDFPFRFGFALTSRGIYVNSLQTREKTFFRYTDLKCVRYDESEKDLIFGNIPISLNQLYSKRKPFYNLVASLFEKIPTVNNYYLEVLKENYDAHIFSKEEYELKKSAIVELKQTAAPPKNEVHKNNQAPTKTSDTTYTQNSETSTPKKKDVIVYFKIGNKSKKGHIDSYTIAEKLLDALKTNNGPIDAELIFEDKNGSILQFAFDKGSVSSFFMYNGDSRYAVLENAHDLSVIKQMVLDYFCDNYEFNYITWY